MCFYENIGGLEKIFSGLEFFIGKVGLAMGSKILHELGSDWVDRWSKHSYLIITI